MFVHFYPLLLAFTFIGSEAEFQYLYSTRKQQYKSKKALTFIYLFFFINNTACFKSEETIQYLLY